MIVGGLGGLLALVIGGCPAPAEPNNASGFDTSNNGSFATAAALNLGSRTSLDFQGSISTPTDVDVYALGDLAVGDRVVLDITALTSGLDLVVTLFDGNDQLVAFNDDRTLDASNLNPYLDVAIPGAPGSYYLGIAQYPGDNRTGQYEVRIELTRGAGVRGPASQIVFLDWDGGLVASAALGTFTLPPFDAAQVGLSSSQTQSLKNRVAQIVAQRFSGYALVLLSSDNDSVPAAPHSTVYFGGRDPSALAISEAIDALNANPTDNALIYTGTFNGAFTGTPTLEQMATALGNTVAHEIGHLLGLVHTESCTELMDATCTNNALLVPQQFGTAPIDPQTFAIGSQDAVQLLNWILGQ
jgi:hypothetical protein